MAGTHRWNKEQPRGRGEFFSDAVGRNIRFVREAAHLSQKDVVERMGVLGHKWYVPTVGQIERGLRPVSVEELLCLAIALRTSVYNILSPASEVMYGKGPRKRPNGVPAGDDLVVSDIDLGPASEIEPIRKSQVDQLVYPPDRTVLWMNVVEWKGNRPLLRDMGFSESMSDILKASGVPPARRDVLLEAARKVAEVREIGVPPEEIDALLEGAQRVAWSRSIGRPREEIDALIEEARKEFMVATEEIEEDQ